MKKSVDKIGQRNVVLLPIAATLHGPGCEVDWTGGCGIERYTTPQHTAAQDMADKFGLCPVSGFSYDWPGTDYGGENAPFTMDGPLDAPPGTNGQELGLAWATALHDMGVNVRGFGVHGNPDGIHNPVNSIDWSECEPAEWYGPFLVRGQDGGSPREVTRLVMLAAHRRNGVDSSPPEGMSGNDGELVAASLWLAIPRTEYLLSDARGRYIPRDFAEGILCATTDEKQSVCPPIFIRVDDLRIDDAKPVALYLTDGGGALCEWVPGTFTDVPKPGHNVCRVPARGHVLDFYDEAAVDSRWEFDAHVLDYITDICDPDSEFYWESWEYVMERCHVRLQITGTLCDHSEDMAEFDGTLVQDGDLWLVYEPKR